MMPRDQFDVIVPQLWMCDVFQTTWWEYKVSNPASVHSSQLPEFKQSYWSKALNWSQSF